MNVGAVVLTIEQEFFEHTNDGISLMTTMLNLRTADATRNRAALAMTCDVPLVRERKPRLDGGPGAVCRPTGRRPYPRPAVAAPERLEAQRTRPWRSNVRTGPHSEPGASNIGARQIWIASMVTGIGLALLVLVLGLVGSDYQKAVGQEPARTQVVHVRSGESLSALAARIAPELPAAAVIATVRDLNDLQSSGLRPGQALVVPDYR